MGRVVKKSETGRKREEKGLYNALRFIGISHFMRTCLNETWRTSSIVVDIHMSTLTVYYMQESRFYYLLIPIVHCDRCL